MRAINLPVAVLAAFLPCAAAAPAQTAKLGDVVTIEGVEDNFLSGIGLVVGLQGSGDGDGVARRLAANLLKRRDINVDASEISAANIAVVEVQANLPAFKRAGDTIDVFVSSMGGKAKSLFGGRLVAMQLTGPDPNEFYAVAQGPIVSGMEATGASGSTERVNHPTAGRITNGAKVVREVPQRIVGRDVFLRLKLRDASFATAKNVADVVDGRIPGSARAVDAQTIEVKLPPGRRSDPVPLIDELFRLDVRVEPRAKVVIDANTGTITIGQNVTLLPGAIAHGSVSVSIQESTQVSQPGPLSNGTTTQTPSSQVKIESKGTDLRPLPAATSAADVARALNTLGLGPRDLVAVFQSLKANGMLAAELVIQ